MVDMDILVKKEDVLRAEKLLTERGFSREIEQRQGYSPYKSAVFNRGASQYALY